MIDHARIREKCLAIRLASMQGESQPSRDLHVIDPKGRYPLEVVAGNGFVLRGARCSDFRRVVAECEGRWCGAEQDTGRDS